MDQRAQEVPAPPPAPQEKKEDFEAVIASAKRRHRPRLKNWSKDGFATRRLGDFERLATEPCRGTEEIAREPHTLTQEEFELNYERTSTPLMVSGCVAAEGWAAEREWASYKDLLEVERGPAENKTADSKTAYPKRAADLRLKCGEDDKGRKVKLSVAEFERYARENSDDSPLYIFDSGFADRAGSGIGLEAFKVPKFCAKHDLFELVGDDRRPPHRWWLMGPERSGTCCHIDPLGTSAWNTVVSGRKRWVLFEPGTTKNVAKGSKLVGDKEDDEAINYFVDILPRIRGKHPFARRIECVQNPGETIYVPGGWWHAVINLDDTIGVTQNFASFENFDSVWEKTRTGRRGMAHQWARRLRSSANPVLNELGDRAARRPPLTRSSEKQEQPKNAHDRSSSASSHGCAVVSSATTSSSPNNFRRDKSPTEPRDFADRKRKRRKLVATNAVSDEEEEHKRTTAR